MSTVPQGPVLLLGAGPGLATTGLLYLATYLRRHGTEAYARPIDTAPTLEELERRVHWVLDSVRPRVVGISLKWFLHLYRGLFIAGVVKAHDRTIRVVLGGDTASHYYRELLEFDAVDHVIRGDGEAPLLAIARGAEHENVWQRGRAARHLLELEGAYTQTRDTDDTYLSDLDAAFLCESDRYYLAPFVVGGKGCSQACLYCGGARTAQNENFGRRRSFMRPAEHVRQDILELSKRAYTLVYDFSDHPLSDPTASLAELWRGLDFSKSGILYYAWRVPPKDFISMLAQTYESVTLGLDFGCFSDRQRKALIARHALKPLPGDDEFLEALAECARHPNVTVRVSAVAGLPLSEPEDLQREQELVQRILEFDIVEDVLYDRVHAQPGAPLLKSVDDYGLISPTTNFQEFLAWSEEHAPNGQYVPPVLLHETRPEDLTLGAARLGKNQRIALAHGRLKRQIAEAMKARAPDPDRFPDFGSMAERRFVRSAKARILNRYVPANWWLECERPPLEKPALLEPTARIVHGHVWQEEFGAVSVPSRVADYVLPAFDSEVTVQDALARIRARNASIEEPVLHSIVRFFYERSIVCEVA